MNTPFSNGIWNILFNSELELLIRLQHVQIIEQMLSLARNLLIPVTMILPQPCCFARQVTFLHNVFLPNPRMGTGDML